MSSLEHLIDFCIKGDRRAQKEFYRRYYALGMGICLRYTKDDSEAMAILNEGFYKIFINIASVDRSRPIEAWVRTIITNTAIDHCRLILRNSRHLHYTSELPERSDWDRQMPDLEYQDLLNMIRELPNAYRTVFNLYAIEGYNHDEIAEMLGVTTGTSKSNLFKARLKLKKMIAKRSLSTTSKWIPNRKKEDSQ